MARQPDTKKGEKDYSALFARYEELGKLYDVYHPDLGHKEGLKAVGLFSFADVQSSETRNDAGATIRRTEVSYDLLPAPKDDENWTKEYFHRTAVERLPKAIEETIIDGQRRALVLTRNDGTRHIRNYDDQGELVSHVLEPAKDRQRDGAIMCNKVKNGDKYETVLWLNIRDMVDIQAQFDGHGLISGFTGVNKEEGVTEEFIIAQGYLRKAIARKPNGDETHYDYGEKNKEPYDRYMRSPKMKTRYWADFNSTETRKSIAGVLQDLKPHEFLHYFPDLNFANNDMVGKSLFVAMVTGDPQGSAGHYTRDTQFEWRGGFDYLQHLAQPDFLPQKMNETIIDGVCRERISTMINGAVCTQKFGSDGQLHAENGDAAMVLKHEKGKLLEFRENGKLHCLHGACRRGVDINGNEVAHYAIHGIDMNKDQFYAHPLVQDARSLGGRVSRWFNRVTGNTAAVDLVGIAGAALNGDTRVARAQTLMNTLTPDMRREVVTHLGNSYPDFAPAGFEAWRDRNVQSQAQARVAGDDLLRAVDRIDAASQEINKFAGDFANPMMRGMMQSLAAEVSLLKDTYEDTIAHARGQTAAQKSFAGEKSRVIDEMAKILQQGVSPIPAADEMRAVMQAVSKGYQKLPMPAQKDAANYQHAVAEIDQKLGTVRQGFQSDLGMVARTADTLNRFLDLRETTPISLSSLDSQQPVPTTAPLPSVLKIPTR